MFALSSLSSGLELLLVNHISIHENSELKDFKNRNSLVKYLIIDQMIC